MRAVPRPRAAGRILAASLIGLILLVAAPPVRAEDPLNVVRAFLQADGRGDRIDPRRWPRIAPLVAWELEPAWDHLYLIHGFELGTPVLRDGLVEVEVRYTVTSEVRSSGATSVQRVEPRTYRLERVGLGGWRIRPPAPPPYVFAAEADPQALAALLQPENPLYLSDSAFVWRMLRDAGWLIAYSNTADLESSADYTAPRTAEVGDLALYFDGDRPYHVAIVDSEDTVVSATLNAGIQRSIFGAFAGEIRYRRPVAVVRVTPTPGP